MLMIPLESLVTKQTAKSTGLQLWRATDEPEDSGRQTEIQ